VGALLRETAERLQGLDLERLAENSRHLRKERERSF